MPNNEESEVEHSGCLSGAEAVGSRWGGWGCPQADAPGEKRSRHFLLQHQAEGMSSLVWFPAGRSTQPFNPLAVLGKTRSPCSTVFYTVTSTISSAGYYGRLYPSLPCGPGSYYVRVRTKFCGNLEVRQRCLSYGADSLH